MKAQLLDGFGDASAFEVREVPAPEPGAGEVRVRVAAVGVNPLDGKIRSGMLSGLVPVRFPAILGSEFAGIVDAVGDGVTGFGPGDRVAGFARSGGYAEFVVTTPEKLALVSDGLSLVRAATLPTAAETAQRVIAAIEPEIGQTVLVNGAAGSVGSAVVQLLAAAGVRVVGTASPENHAYLRSLGATPVAYGPGLLAEVAAVSRGIDAAIDTAGRGFADQVLGILPPERIVTIVDFPAAAKGVQVSGGDPLGLTAATIGPVLALAAEGRFATEIAAEFPLDGLPAAHLLSEGGHLRGKIVIRVADLDAAPASGAAVLDGARA